jgi:hypothetical protein
MSIKMFSGKSLDHRNANAMKMTFRHKISPSKIFRGKTLGRNIISGENFVLKSHFHGNPMVQKFPQKTFFS